MHMFANEEQARTDEVTGCMLEDAEFFGYDEMYVTEDGIYFVWQWDEASPRPHASMHRHVGAILTKYLDGQVLLVEHDHAMDFEVERSDIAARADVETYGIRL